MLTRYAFMRRLVVAAASISMLGVCASCKSAEDVVEEFRPRAEAKLETMRKATKAALDNPVKKPPKLSEKLRYDGDAPNAYLVHSEWLEVPPKPSEHDILIQAGPFPTVRNLLSGTASPTGVPDYYEKTFEGFLGVRWLVVVETRSFDAGVATDESSFLGGGWHGMLHFVDLEKGGSIGSIEVESSHSDTVKVHDGEEQSGLSSDVWVHARNAINEALTPYRASDQKPL